MLTSSFVCFGFLFGFGFDFCLVFLFYVHALTHTHSTPQAKHFLSHTRSLFKQARQMRIKRSVKERRKLDETVCKHSLL